MTLVHYEWPCDIDIHWHFPGLHADPDVAFEALWEHRQDLTVASTAVATETIVVTDDSLLRAYLDAKELLEAYDR